MKENYYLRIAGEPLAKARPRASVINGHARVYTPAKTANYEAKVALAWQEKYPNMKPIEGPLLVSIDCCFPFPKQAYWPVNKKHNGELRNEWLYMSYTKKPDCDNLAKSVLDGLNGVAFRDDSQIYHLSVGKYYGENPEVLVTIALRDDPDE